MSSEIINHFILRFKLRLTYWMSNKNAKFVSSDNRKRCFFFLAADYGNLGDVAITYAQTKFLIERFPDYEVVEIPISKTFAGIKAVKRIVRKEDIVVTVGGGNMGDMYDDIEFLRQMVIRSFRNNRIISFPQTFDFSHSFSGRIALSIAKCVYSSHHLLTVLAREAVSFDLMKLNFSKNDVKLVPDIVMTLDERRATQERKDVVLCLRNDSELKYNIRSKVEEYITSIGLIFTNYDTHIGRGNLSVEERNQELNSIWDAFSKSEFVVTDRLHGMIFAFITGTPALVVPNSNHKIKSSYEWIKDCGYIRLIEDPSSLESEISTLRNHTENHFDEVHNQIMSAYNCL